LKNIPPPPHPLPGLDSLDRNIFEARRSRLIVIKFRVKGHTVIMLHTKCPQSHLLLGMNLHVPRMFYAKEECIQTRKRLSSFYMYSYLKLCLTANF